MNTLNPIRGKVQVTLGEEKRTLRFNNNAFRIVSQHRGITMTQMFKRMQDQDQMLEIVYDLIEAAFRNECDYMGHDCLFTSRQIQAWIGEMSDDDVTAVLHTIQSSVSGGKAQEAGNSMAPTSRKKT